MKFLARLELRVFAGPGHTLAGSRIIPVIFGGIWVVATITQLGVTQPTGCLCRKGRQMSDFDEEMAWQRVDAANKRWIAMASLPINHMSDEQLAAHTRAAWEAAQEATAERARYDNRKV